MIYFFKCDDAIKIGFTGSNSPDTRLKACQTGSSSAISITGVMPGSNQDEKALHDMFSSYRKSGEWFTCHSDLDEYISSNAVNLCDYMKVIKHIRHPDPVKPDMSKYVTVDNMNNLGRKMDALLMQETLTVKELRAQVARLQHKLDVARPAIIFAIENPDIVDSCL